ncbi:Transmembrane secretion effector [Rhizobiales bacterium GAS191]|nr:Transmembrane secretion effector [Rhizobiales bacterium GAS113]SED67180.1 Transmembrane secretion effector [Rhizobiales bacterium GAS188]SEE84028.1 Transmembrane secretion effector [Rhizobiales bacterium GAS191]
MSLASPAASLTLLGHQPFRLYFWARGFSEFSYQIGAVAVGWQVYALTGSAFALGMVGLVQFIPTALLVFAAGHAADRYDRKRVVQLCQIVAGLAAAFLAWGSFAGWLNVAEILAAVAVFGAATAFESPAAAALLPGVVPEGMLQKGTALSTAAFQLAIISGPALGGLAYVVAPGVPYAAMAAFWLLAGILNGAIRLDRPATAKEPPTLAALFAGVGFVRRNPAILGTISLDLFAVLLGGATALMPIYARDILHTGPWGLGVLRGAPAVGALLMTALLARHAIDRRLGIRMFQAVIVFGLATVAFALSGSLWLSILALAIMGAADTVSVVIRISLVQLATPDEMRGRVGAVNYLFINASSQLGEFESGMTAALFGAMPAALLGGVGTVAVALLWMRLFPTLRDLERLE